MSREDLPAKLAAVVGEAFVLTAPSDTEPFTVDLRGRYHGTAIAVVRPGTTDEVAALVKLCAKEQVAVVPQGGNTGLCGGATPMAASPSIVIRLDRLNQIRDASPLDDTITVGAGCVLADIQAAAQKIDRLFPLSLGAEGSCQIGGNISTNAGGIAVLRYGSMRQLVLGIEAVLADGSVFDGLRRLRKDNAGYDLKQLFIGAEGTLGIVTAAVLKLFPKLNSRCVAMAELASVSDALSLFELARKRFGERISSFEIIGSSYMEFVLTHVKNTTRPFAQKAAWYVLIEAGDAEPEVDLAGAMEQLLADALEGSLISDAVVAASIAQEEALWRLRHGVSNEFRHAGKTMAHDTSVPLAQQPAFTAQVEEKILAAYPDAEVMMVGHIGDGNIHLVVLFPHARFADQAAFEAASDAIDVIIDDIAIGMGGSITAEHGVGFTCRKRLARTKPALELALMRAIKQALDPNGIMNPGKVLFAEDPL
jgi:FAD/FMN-containing dehydrogenase